MLNSIEIENYRSIKSLSIEGFGNVNIFIGENDIGKTTVLEGIFLVHCQNIMQNIIPVSNLREYKIDSIESLNIFWNNRNEKRNISFKYKFDDREFVKSLEFSSKSSSNAAPFVEEHFTHTKKILKSDWNINFSADNEISYFEKIISSDPKTKVPNLHVRLFSPKITHVTKELLTTASETLTFFERGNDLINNLKIFNPNIISLHVHKNEMLVNIENEGKPIRLPIQSLGSGFVFIVSLLVNISNGNYKALIIDEIENGQHVNNIRKIFAFLLKYCHENKIQLFLGTHSYDVIRIALESQGDLDDEIDINCFKLMKDLDDSHRCIQFTEEELKFVTSESIEIR
jgi:AAA15 family ATPase/GTPase